MGNPDQAIGLNMELSERLAYIAGVVDGEGSICIGNPSGNNYQTTLTVRMDSKKVIENIFGLLSGSISNKGKTWRFQCNGDKAVSSLSRIIPYLSGKKRQAELAIDFASLEKFQGSRNGTYPEGVAKKKNEAFDKMKEYHLPNLTEEPDLSGESLTNAYCAGLIDGEGWIGIGKSGRGHSTMVAVEMTDLAPVSRFARAFGGNVRVETRKTKRGKSVFRCRIERKKAELACRAMLPYLKEKFNQAEILILYANNVTLWNRRGIGIRPPKEVMIKRLNWIDRIRELNRCAGAETKPDRPETVSDSPICNDSKVAEQDRNDLASGISISQSL